MRQLGKVYELVHQRMVCECTANENRAMYNALTLKLRKILGHGDLEDEKELEQAAIFYELSAKHIPKVKWMQVVDACEDRVINENRVHITPANVIKWAKNHYECLPKKTPAYNSNQISAPHEAPDGFYFDRYLHCLAQWAHGHEVWDINHFAYDFLVREGRIEGDVTAAEQERVNDLATHYIKREEGRVARGESPLVWALHKAQHGVMKSAIKHARLINYFETNEDKQKQKESLPAPTSKLG